MDAALADVYSDLVFTARAGDERVIVCVLFEHQSTNDERMALRLLDYMVRLWMRFIDDKKNAKKPLPVIVPVVLSHAPGGWTASRRFGGLFTPKGKSLAGASLPDFEYAVDDLARLSYEELRARPVQDAVKLTLWVLRDARDGASFLAVAGEWVRVLEAIARDPALRHVAGVLLVYLSRVLDDETMGKFRVILSDEAPAAEELTMTYAETLLAQGRAAGKLEGELAAQAASVLLVLQARGLAVSDEQRARVQGCRDSETLTRWLTAAATAESVETALG